MFGQITNVHAIGIINRVSLQNMHVTDKVKKKTYFLLIHVGSIREAVEANK